MDTTNKTSLMKLRNIVFGILSIITINSYSEIKNPSNGGEQSPNSIKKQKVYSLVKQKKSVEWYNAQSKLWDEYLKENQEDGDAWLNYYTAMRMRKIYNDGVTRDDLFNIVDEMGKVIPNTFEFHYISYWNGGVSQSDDKFSHLQKAYEIDPDRIELWDDFFTHYMLQFDHENLKLTAQKWFESNDLSPGLYAWNYNMLQSTEPNAIIITSGDNDTYPAMVLQYAKGIRTDVTVMNNSMLGSDDYRKKMFIEEGIPLMGKVQKDYKSWSEQQSAIIEHIKANTERPIYFAVSAQPHLYKSFKDEVYNVGMAYKWSKTKFDNIAVTKKNFEKNYLLDYLKIDLYQDISQGVVDQANANYLISMLTLYNHYKESDDRKADELEVLINRIAEKNNMQEKVAEVLKKSNPQRTSLVIDDPREIESGILKINDTLYAGQTEVSNGMYELFLTDLLKQKRYADLQLAKAEKVDWMNLLDKTKDLKAEDVFPNGHPDGENHPVVNISHDAAIMYCEWLTEVYNSLENKKKKFGKVEFRLPTEKEWEMIAIGGQKIEWTATATQGQNKGLTEVGVSRNANSPYAWGGPYCRNAKGCFLANLDVSEVSKKEGDKPDCEGCNGKDDDGGYFPVEVTSYSPNEFGLYCLTGNVSEMTQVDGVVKGGSWNTLAGVATINNKEIINLPSPEVGFRVIMVVK